MRLSAQFDATAQECDDPLAFARRRLFIFTCLSLGGLGVLAAATLGGPSWSAQPVRWVAAWLIPAAMLALPAFTLRLIDLRGVSLFLGLAVFAHAVILVTGTVGAMASAYLIVAPPLLGLLVSARSAVVMAASCLAAIHLLAPESLPTPLAFAIAAACIAVTSSIFVFQRVVERRLKALAAERSDLRKAMEGWRRRAALCDDTLQNLAQGVVVCDEARNIVLWNSRFCELMDMPEIWLAQGRSLEDHGAFSAERSARLEAEEANPLAPLLERRRAGEIVKRVVRRPDDRYVKITVSDRSGGGVLATFEDVTAQELSKQALKAQAREDPLTGLLNRNLFETRIMEACEQTKAADEKAALLLLDLDHFKPVNDQYGHVAGDEALRVVARRIRSSLRASDSAFRIGGDEFAVVLKIESVPDLEAVAGRLLSAVREPIAFDGRMITVGASIGAVVVSAECCAVEDLVKTADHALYEAKNGGRNGFRIVSCRLGARVKRAPASAA